MSECVCCCQALSDVRCVVDHQCVEHESAAAVSDENVVSAVSIAQADELLAVLPQLSCLNVGESISMMASYAVYTLHTRCHTIRCDTGQQAAGAWVRGTTLAAELLLNSHYGSLRRRGVVMGAFVTRHTPAVFTVGLVTHGSARDLRLEASIEAFRGPHSLAQSNAELPLCATRRSATVRLWWEPRAERVTPRQVMAPMRVIVEQDCESLEQSHIFGYEAVSVFLCRPAASVLLGTTRKSLSGAWSSFTYKSTPPLHSRSLCRQKSLTAGGQFTSIETNCASGKLSDKVRAKLSAVLRFDDLSPTEVGEHLVGVELEAHPAYRPFVSSQYAHMPPFLVVTSGTA
ncbi:hypothetical protein ERJ75_001642500 [Trypanosoma vivax]|nr:hypothetical protein ERJ75_001642500 [Trypanosoma vivax]